MSTNSYGESLILPKQTGRLRIPNEPWKFHAAENHVVPAAFRRTRFGLPLDGEYYESPTTRKPMYCHGKWHALAVWILQPIL